MSAAVVGGAGPWPSRTKEYWIQYSDPEKSFSLEVVRIMLEFGMFNYLLHGFHIILLQHPLAPHIN